MCTPEEIFPVLLLWSILQMFFFRCCPLPHHHHQVSFHSLVQVYMVHKVSLCFFFFYRHFSSFLIFEEESSLSSLTALVFLPVFLPWLSAGALGFSVRGMGNNTPQLNRNLTQGTQLPSHITPTTGVPTMSLHTPPSPSRYVWRCLPFADLVYMHMYVVYNIKYLEIEMAFDIKWGKLRKIQLNQTWQYFNRGTLPMNTRNMLNHSQVGQGIGMSGRTNSMGSSGLGSPNRSSPSIICMPKQQPARQPFTINR